MTPSAAQRALTPAFGEPDGPRGADALPGRGGAPSASQAYDNRIVPAGDLHQQPGCEQAEPGGFVVWVDGIPRPQGSKSAFVHRGRVVLKESSKALPSWRRAVKNAAREAYAWTLSGPLVLRATFYFVRPASHSGKRGLNSKATPAPVGKTTHGDLSKLWRAIEDSLVDAQVIADDCLITSAEVRKRWGDRAGVAITVAPDRSITPHNPFERELPLDAIGGA